jgi:putative membrane protein
MRRLLYSLSIALFLLPMSAWAQTQQPDDRYSYGPHMMMWGAGGMFGMFFMMLMIILIIVTVVLLVRWFGGPAWVPTSHHMPMGRTSLDILKDRFARGEIDKIEFEERRRVLGD